MWTLINESTSERFTLQTSTKDNPDNGIYLCHNLPGNWTATFKLVESDNFPSLINEQTGLQDQLESKYFAKYSLQEDTSGITYSGGFLLKNPVSTNGLAVDETYSLTGGGLFEYVNSKPNAYPKGTTLKTILDNLLKYSKLDGKIDYTTRTNDLLTRFFNRFIIANKYTIKDTLIAVLEECDLNYFVKPDSSIYISDELNFSNQKELDFFGSLSIETVFNIITEQKQLFGNTTGKDIQDDIKTNVFNGFQDTAMFENIFQYLTEQEQLQIIQNNSDYLITTLNDFNLNITTSPTFLTVDSIKADSDLFLRIIINCIEYYDDRVVLHKKQVF